MKTNQSGDGRFVRRIVQIAIIAAILLALWRLRDVGLVIFGAILLAVALTGLSRRFQRLTGCGPGSALTAVVLAVIALSAAVLWLFGSQIAAQYDEIAARVPAAFDRMRDGLLAHPLGQYLLERMKGAEIATATGAITRTAAQLMSSIARFATYGAFVIFGAVYLAADPRRYRDGVLRLIPPARRARYGRLLDLSGHYLEKWLLGQLAVMATVGTLSGFGLWLLGIDAAPALGLTGGLLCFIPFVGAILAAVPATLMALTQSPADAAFTVVLFLAIHFVEGNFITPLVQDEAVSLPPVLSVFATLVFTILFGPFAVMVAVPITIVAIAAVELLYIEDELGEPSGWPGNRAIAQAAAPPTAPPDSCP